MPDAVTTVHLAYILPDTQPWPKDRSREELAAELPAATVPPAPLVPKLRRAPRGGLTVGGVLLGGALGFLGASAGTFGCTNVQRLTSNGYVADRFYHAGESVDLGKGGACKVSVGAFAGAGMGAAAWLMGSRMERRRVADHQAATARYQASRARWEREREEGRQRFEATVGAQAQADREALQRVQAANAAARARAERTQEGITVRTEPVAAPRQSP